MSTSHESARVGGWKRVSEWTEGRGEERTKDPLGQSSSLGALSLEGSEESGSISESFLLCVVLGDTFLTSSRDPLPGNTILFYSFGLAFQFSFCPSASWSWLQVVTLQSPRLKLHRFSLLWSLFWVWFLVLKLMTALPVGSTGEQFVPDS